MGDSQNSVNGSSSKPNSPSLKPEILIASTKSLPGSIQNEPFSFSSSTTEKGGHARKSSKEMLTSTGADGHIRKSSKDSIDDSDRLDRSDRSSYNINGAYAPSSRNKQMKGIQSNINSKVKELHDPNGPKRCSVDMKYKLSKPRDPEQCPLFCSFYAEFDNKVGPKICYQSPRYFMDQDIAITIDEIHDTLYKSFFDSNQHEPPTVPSNSQSIFDSTCEYIISELTGQLISISTHNMHIIAKPIIIQDPRYERNSFLFSVGFVIRRQIDPAPFRPLLTTLASTLRSMEVESQLLSNLSTKSFIQDVLDVMLPSLNSQSAKCHMLLDSTNSLHLQYFPAPKEHPSVIKDYVVPVLLRPESHLYSLGWDLTINWIVPHINGIQNARCIAKSSQVDEEMVRACLRVLRHHNVLACVDVFRYSNTYESTRKSQLLFGRDMLGLMEEAYQFVRKVQKRQCSPTPLNMTLIPPQVTDEPQSYPPFQIASSKGEDPSSFSYVSTSSPKFFHQNNAPHSCDGFTPNQISQQNRSTHLVTSHENKEKSMMILALSILYTSCDRSHTLGDVIINKLSNNNMSNREHKLNGISKIKSSGLPSCFESDQNCSQKIDWKEVFTKLDFRRFVSFGVIHDLIHRVHEFPITVDSLKMEEVSEFENKIIQMKMSSKLVQMIGEAPAMSTRKLKSQFSTQQSVKSDKRSEDILTLANSIAASMDGTRSDDELTCMFEREMKELKIIVEKYTTKEVISIYSTVIH